MSNNDQHQFKDRYMLRLPDGMRDRIKAAAETNNRSMNAELVATLEEKYPAPPPDAEAEKLAAIFEALSHSAQKQFVNKYVMKKFSLDDIADGLVPGVRISERDSLSGEPEEK